MARYLLILLISITTFAEQKVGVLIPLSGEVAPFGEIVRAGIKQAKDYGVELVFEDTICTPKGGLSSYKKLSETNNIQYFLGPCCGASMNVVAPLLVKNQHISMGLCGMTKDISKASSQHIYLPQYSIDDESKYNANTIWEMGHKKVALVFIDTEFSRMHEKVFKQTYQGEIETLILTSFDVSQLKAVALKMKSLDFDAVYVPHVEPFLLGLLVEMHKVGIRDKKIFSIYSVQMQEVLDINSEHTEGLIYSYPDIPDNQDAIQYFPKLGAEILLKTVSQCKSDYNCVKNSLNKNYAFNEDGILEGKIILKTVKNGKFLRYDQ